MKAWQPLTIRRPLLRRHPLAGAGLVSLYSFAAAMPAGATMFDCVMEPAQKVKIGSAVTGVLKNVPVQRGDLVTAGQSIARLDDSVEAAAVALAQTQADSTEGIEAQRARLNLARERLERARPLALKDIVSKDKLQGIEADYEVAVRDLNTEIVKHHLAEIEVVRAKATLALRDIKSPLTGLVMDRNLLPGEFVNQEAFIMTLVQLDPLYIEAYIPVAYYRLIKPGVVGTVLPAEPIGGSYRAPITVIDRVFDAASGTFQIRLELRNPGSKLPGGERCRIDLDLPALSPQASLPASGMPPPTGAAMLAPEGSGIPANGAAPSAH